MGKVKNRIRAIEAVYVHKKPEAAKMGQNMYTTERERKDGES